MQQLFEREIILDVTGDDPVRKAQFVMDESVLNNLVACLSGHARESTNKNHRIVAGKLAQEFTPTLLALARRNLRTMEDFKRDAGKLTQESGLLV